MRETRVFVTGFGIVPLLVIPAFPQMQGSDSGQEKINLIKGVYAGLCESHMPSGDASPAEYQKQNGLMVSGVPSPETPELLPGES